MRYKKEEVLVANKTFRATPRVGLNAIVPRYILENFDNQKDLEFLDFGSGKVAMHCCKLREKGFKVDAYEFGENYDEKIHVKYLEKKYDVVYCSNVLNVQSSVAMLKTTLLDICSFLKKNGTMVCNYPKEPRKLQNFENNDLLEILENFFDDIVVVKQKNGSILIVCKNNKQPE